MRFLAKDDAARAAAQGEIYDPKGHNERLRSLLLAAQQGFCAYTEKRVTPLDTCAVEHFDARLKGTPDDAYDNWYATLQSANQRKRGKERKHREAPFFKDRFFQEPTAFMRRVRYVAQDGVYEEVDQGDASARDLIDFLGLNDHPLWTERRRHVGHYRELFAAAEWGKAEQVEYFRQHSDDLSFPTALIEELGLALDELLTRGGR